MDTHRWVPLPTVGFTANGQREESQDDVSPPSLLMEYPPLAVFVNGNIFNFSLPFTAVLELSFRLLNSVLFTTFL